MKATLILLVALVVAAVAFGDHDDGPRGSNRRNCHGHHKRDPYMTLVHFGDIPEIVPVGVQAEGGFPRLGSLLKQLREENDDTIKVVTTGDLLYPSVFGDTWYGKNIVDMLNTLHVDYATYGNHEFDKKKTTTVYPSLDLANFTFVSTNVVNKGTTVPFHNSVASAKITLNSRPDICVGLLGFTKIDNTYAGSAFMSVLDKATSFALAKQYATNFLEVEGCSLVIAMTHWDVQTDAELSRAVPEIAMIVGGHDHENYELRRGPFTNVDIFKGNANLKNVWVHHIHFDCATKKVKARMSELKHMTPENFDDDADTAARVKYWTDQGFVAVTASGFNVTAPVAQIPVTFDLFETTVRSSASTPFTDIVLNSWLAAATNGQFTNISVAIINSGSFRLDGLLAPGLINEYDVLMMYPYADNGLQGADIKGSQLRAIFEEAWGNTAILGTGFFLNAVGITRVSAGVFKVNGVLVDDNTTYAVIGTNYIFTGATTSTGVQLLLSSIAHPDTISLFALPGLPDPRRAIMNGLHALYPPQ